MALDFTTGMAVLQGTDYSSSLAPSFAMQAWVNADALAGHVMSLFDSANTPTDYEQFKIDSGNLVYEFNDGTAIGSITTAITSNTWYHALALVKANNNRELWLDGTCVGTTNLAVAPSARNRIILGKFGAGTDFDGRIAETAVWSLNSNFDSGDISGLSAGYTPLQIRFEETFSYWPLLDTGPWVNQVQTGASSLDLFTDGTTPTIHSTHPNIIPFADSSYDPPYWGISCDLTGISTFVGQLGALLAGQSAMAGIATVFPSTQMQMALTTGLTGIGSMFASLINLSAVVTLGGMLTGVATLGATTTRISALTAAFSGVANYAFYAEQAHAAIANLSASAFVYAYADHYRPMTSNPPLAGDLIPITNQARFLLTVNTTPVSLAHPYFNMEELYFDYDKKTLSFSEIATPTIGRPTWNPEGNVKLEIDFNDGDGLITYFTGQITRRNHYGVNNEESIKYQAEGIQTLANRVTLLNTTAKPEVIFTVGTTVLTIVGSTEVTTTFSKTIRNAVIDLFTVMSSSLMANSISAAVDTPTLNTINGDLPQTVQITNQGFFSGLSQVMGFEPGKRAYWDDTIQKWTFPDIPNAVTILTQIESSQLENCIYDVSTEGRYTAIRLVADQESGIDDNLITKTQTLETDRGNFNIQRVDVSLTKKWDSTIEGNWSYWRITEETTQITSGGVPLFDTPYQWVYRRWAMPEGTIEQWPGTPINFYAKHIEVQGNTSTERWVKFGARADFKRKEIISRDFILSKYSDPYVEPLDPTKRTTYGPAEVKMTYYPRGFLYGTFVSSISTAGTPTYVTTNFDSSLLFDEMRYPVNGYEGTAYSMFNVQREFVEIVDITEVTTANAMSRLAPLKDVVISGELPFIGDPVKSFMNLRAKVRVAHATKLTGIQSVDAYMMGYRYQFGRPGGNYVQLSTDKAALVRV